MIWSVPNLAERWSNDPGRDQSGQLVSRPIDGAEAGDRSPSVRHDDFIAIVYPVKVSAEVVLQLTDPDGSHAHNVATCSYIRQVLPD